MSPKAPHHFLNRELSWLEFNGRVLEEALEAKNPLLERLRFFCIFYSNLDEFFMVRVASLIRRIEEEDYRPDAAGLTPRDQLERILVRVRELSGSSRGLYEEKLLPALAKEKIRILNIGELNPAQEKYLDDYFDREIYPVLTPVAIDVTNPFPRLQTLSINLAVLVVSEKEPGSEPRLAIVQVPTRLPGLCRLPDGGSVDVCWLIEAIQRGLPRLFPGYRILESAGFRLTRDSEMELDDEGQDDFLRMVESGLKKRRRGQPVRFEYDERMTPGLREQIRSGLEADEMMAVPVRGPLEPRPLFQLADMPGFDRLRYKPQPPLLPAVFEQERDIFRLIREKDILLHHPYDSFDPVVNFIQTAAEDPDVLAIKQVLYRTSGTSSPLVQALMRAADGGKQVTVLLELTARFDEERNIHWAKDLEDAGAHVLYGLVGLKVHAKIALVVRRESDGIRRYVHLGTGNYNEKTARLYTDFGLFTAADDVGADASGFFNTITGYSEPKQFNRLVMSPLALREKVISLIRREADWARSGQISGITAKMNSLVDPKIISELYSASAAGVPVRLNIRGICCLRPGISGLSENIRVISIVDRYLEHSRVIHVRNGGSDEIFLSSADWMPRNLDRRVELMFPVLEESARQRVVEALGDQFSDNQRARALKSDGTYERVPAGRLEPCRAQERLYRRLQESHEHRRATTPVRFVPLEAKG